MKSFNRTKVAVGTILGLGLLCGCGSPAQQSLVNSLPSSQQGLYQQGFANSKSAPAAGATCTGQRANRTASNLVPVTTRPVIYGMFVNSVYGYTIAPPHSEVRSLRLDRNQFTSFTISLATDTAGCLYVAVGGDGEYNGVDVFTPGAKKPTYVLDIYDYAKVAPNRVAVSNKGYVAAMLGIAGSEQPPAGVMIWRPGQTKPCAEVRGIGFQNEITQGAFDTNGNLYVYGWDSYSQGVSIGLVRGLCSAKQINALSLNLTGRAEAIAVDTQNNLLVTVAGSPYRVMDVFPPGSKSPSKIIKFSNNAPEVVVFEGASKMWASYKYLFTEWSYPAGGSPIEQFSTRQIKEFKQLGDVAVSPAAK